MQTKNTMSALEQSELSCQRQDAALLRQALATLMTLVAAPRDIGADRLEAAIVACRRRDQRIAATALEDMIQTIRHPLGGGQAHA